MKRRLFIFMAAVAVTVACVLGVAGCSKKHGDNDNTNGGHEHRWSSVLVNDEVSGKHYQTCEECDEKLYGEHVYKKETTSPTCTSQGYTVYTCDCGHTYTGDYTDMTEHNYSQYYSSPLCSESGTYLFKYCKDCGYVESSSFDGTAIHPHEYELIPAEDATCTEEGILTGFKCKNCGHIEQLVKTPRLGHIYNEAYYQYNNSMHYRVCQRSACGYKYYSRHRRKSGTYRIVRQKTCTQNGEAKYICADCNAEVTEVLPAGHSFNYSHSEIIKAATCTETGIEEIPCRNCDIKKQETIKPLGHAWDDGIVVKQPDCHNKGEIEYSCGRCGEKHSEILDERHNWGDWTVTKQYTCTENGLRIRICKDCGKTDEVIIYAAHKYDGGQIISEPTCVEAGQKLYTCTVCGKTDIKEVKELGHDYESVEEPPTCTESGYSMKVCKRCGDIADCETFAPTGHNLVWAYNNDGHWKQCTRCEYVGEKDEHNLSLRVDKKPTEGGYLIQLYYYCEDGCGYCTDNEGNGGSLDDEDFSGGITVIHVHQDTELIYPTFTCTQDGYSAGLRCAVEGCKQILFEPVPVSAIGHNFKDGECLNWYYVGEELVKCNADYFDVFQTPGIEYEDLEGYSIVKSVGTATAKNIIIASTHNGLPVREIGESAFYSGFYGCEQIESVEISNNVTKIGGSAFSGCIKLVKISLGTEVTSIGEYAFSDCRNLMSITIPDTISYVGVDAFYGCVGLKYNEFDNALYLGNLINKFVVLVKAKNTDIISCVINDNARFVCGNSESTNVKNGAFSGCIKLKDIIIPESVVGIGKGAFLECQIETATLPYWALSYVETGYLKNLVISSGTIIDDGEFAGCSALTNVSIPYGVISIGEDAFYNCSELTDISIPDSITRIGEEAFEGCSNLKYNELNGALYLGNATNKYVVLIKMTDKDVTSFVIAENTKCVYECAFEDCSGLESITISAGITYLPVSAFYGCNNIRNVYYTGNLRGWCELEGILGIMERAIYVDGIEINALRDIVIPYGTTKISDYAFYNFTNLWNVTIPNSVKSIGDFAFWGCYSLSGITIPNSVQSIGNAAFYGCYITDITIPSSVTNLGDYDGLYDAVFYNADLKSITVDSNNPVYASQDGILYNKAKTEILEIPLQLAGAVTIPDGVTSIGLYYGEHDDFSCRLITSIFLPDSVTYIGADTFAGCRYLTIYCEAKSQPEGWNSGWNSYGCPVVWDCKNSDLGDNGCIYASVNSLTYSLKDGIANVVGVTSSISGDIVIPNKIVYKNIEYTVTSVGGQVFNGCDGIKCVTIPKSVTSIDYEAFLGCSNLTNIVFNGTKAEWKAATDGSTLSLETDNITIQCTDGKLDNFGNEI